MIKGDEKRPGSGVKNALLLNEEEIDTQDEEILYAVTIVVSKVKKDIQIAPLEQSEVNGVSFNFDSHMTRLAIDGVMRDLLTNELMISMAKAISHE